MTDDFVPGTSERYDEHSIDQTGVDDEFGDLSIDPEDNLTAAVRVALERIVCAAGEPWVGPDQLEGCEHGHTDCWCVGTIIKGLQAAQAEIAHRNALFALFDKYDSHDILYWRVRPDGSLHFMVNVNDVFYWACSDLEEIEEADLPALTQAFVDVAAVSKYDFYGATLWACRKRGMRPQRPMWTKFAEPLQALFLAAGPEREPGSEG